MKYRCASDLGIPHLCLKITYEDKKQVKYVGGCREDQYCYDSLNEKNEAYCTSKIFQKTEGAQCYGNTECLSRMCMKNKCAALPDGLTCANHFECGNQSYCDDSHICQKIKKEGEQCENDYACGFNLVCGNGKCETMFSKGIGEKSDNKNLCKSGQIYNLNESSVCAEYTKKTLTCDTLYAKSCLYSINTKTQLIESTQSCLPNWNESPFCDSVNDSLWRSFLSIYNEEIKTIDITKISITFSRSLFWNDKINRAYTTAVMYDTINGANKCVYDYFNMNYINIL